MKKLIVLTMLFVFLTAPMAHAKTLKEVVNGMTIQKLTIPAVAVTYAVVSTAWKVVSFPFWLGEKVAR